MSRPLLIALHRGHSVIGKLIRWQTRSDWSHASLLLPDGQHVEAREGKGVIEHAGFTPGGSEEVAFFQLKHPLPEIELRRLEAFVARERGAGYDWWMVFAFVTRTHPREASAKNWFCSEFVFAALQAAGVDLLRATEPWEVSPGMLARSPLLTPYAVESPAIV